LSTAVETLQRDQLGPIAAAAAVHLIGRLLAGEIKLRGADFAPTVRALVDIARLEAGEPTSSALVTHVTADEVIARVRALQTSAIAALSAPVSPITEAAGDSPGELSADGSRIAPDGGGS
jgi:hypothetical protein